MAALSSSMTAPPKLQEKAHSVAMDIWTVAHAWKSLKREFDGQRRENNERFELLQQQISALKQRIVQQNEEQASHREQMYGSIDEIASAAVLKNKVAYENILRHSLIDTARFQFHQGYTALWDDFLCKLLDPSKYPIQQILYAGAILEPPALLPSTPPPVPSATSPPHDAPPVLLPGGRSGSADGSMSFVADSSLELDMEPATSTQRHSTFSAIIALASGQKIASTSAGIFQKGKPASGKWVPILFTPKGDLPAPLSVEDKKEILDAMRPTGPGSSALDDLKMAQYRLRHSPDPMFRTAVEAAPLPPERDSARRERPHAPIETVFKTSMAPYEPRYYNSLDQYGQLKSNLWVTFWKKIAKGDEVLTLHHLDHERKPIQRRYRALDPNVKQLWIAAINTYEGILVDRLTSLATPVSSDLAVTREIGQDLLHLMEEINTLKTKGRVQDMYHFKEIETKTPSRRSTRLLRNLAKNQINYARRSFNSDMHVVF